GFRKIQYGPAGAYGVASWLAWILGRPDVARERLQQAFERTQQDPYDTGVLLHMSSILQSMMGNLAEAASYAERALAYSEQHGFPELAIWNCTGLGRVRAMLGRPAEGIELVQRAISAMKARGALVTMTHALTSLAEAQCLAGAIDDGLATINEALG